MFCCVHVVLFVATATAVPTAINIQLRAELGNSALQHIINSTAKRQSFNVESGTRGIIPRSKIHDVNVHIGEGGRGIFEKVLGKGDLSQDVATEMQQVRHVYDSTYYTVFKFRIA